MIRQSLRGKGVVLMGKNTMVRRALRTVLSEFPQYEKVLPFVKGNVGFVFTDGDLKEIRENIVSNRVAAPARAGAIAPVDVYVPAGNTGMEPGKTSFFQALGIPTKIARGTIEIVSDVQVVQAGNKVGTSEATLLNMLNISPFTYGMSVTQIYDNGAVFAPEILDIEESYLLDLFTSGVKTIAALSLATGIPTIASVMHSVVNSYKNLLAIAIATDVDFEMADKVSLRSPSPPSHDVVNYSTRDCLARAWLHRGSQGRLIYSHSDTSLFSEPRTVADSNRSRSTSPTPRPSPPPPPPPPLPVVTPRPPPRRSPLRRLTSRTTTWASVSSTKHLLYSSVLCDCYLSTMRAL
jgi:large subunit ribosomal protein LP0